MITVEDFNSVVNRYGVNSYLHSVDTSLISEEYDFDKSIVYIY